MALALESSNKVWQKVKIALMNANPSAQNAFLELKKYLAQQVGNPDLQFVPFSEAQIIGASGYSPDVDACHVYAIYVKNDGLGDGTDSFVNVLDGTADTGTVLASIVIQDDNAEFFLMYPVTPIVLATDLALSATTTLGGTTESAAHNAGSGFVILGAA